MTEITQIMNAMCDGDPQAASRLLPLVYDELRHMARKQMANERANHTLQPTALVHEAFLQLAGANELPWESRGKFFAAASTAMRRILIDHARRKKSLRRGGNAPQVPLDDIPDIAHTLGTAEDLLDLDEALAALAREDAVKAQLVELVYFAGLSIDEASASLGISRATGNRYWTYSRAWLRDAMRGKLPPDAPKN